MWVLFLFARGEIALVLGALGVMVGFLVTLGETALVGLVMLLFAFGEVPLLFRTLWMMRDGLLSGGKRSLMGVLILVRRDGFRFLVRASHGGPPFR